jgi:ABC-2 type transport system permease protein
VSRKELLQVRRDPLSLLMLLGLPTFMLLIFGYALNFDVRHVKLAVQDRDRSAASRELIAAFVNSTYFDITATPEPGQDPERITAERAAKAVLVIPEGYGAALAAGRAAEVQLLLDGADATTASAILGYAGSIVAEANAEKIRSTLLRRGARGEIGALSYEPRIWYNPELSSPRFLVPGLIGALLMVSAVVSTALSVVRETERCTMEQILVAPIRTAELILGKTLPYLAISFLGAVLILLAARVLFGVEVKGSYLSLFAATLLYLVGALGFGLFLSTLARSQFSAFAMGLLTSLLPSMLLSGFIFQIRIMPGWLQVITHAVPARFYLVILRGIILKGAGLAPYWDQMLALTIFAVVTLSLASLRLARKEA